MDKEALTLRLATATNVEQLQRIVYASREGVLAREG